jgi:hypothetical protein
MPTSDSRPEAGRRITRPAYDTAQLEAALAIHFGGTGMAVLDEIRSDVLQIAQWSGVSPVDVAGVLGHLEAWDMPNPKCRVCGCTDDQACPGGCIWVEDPAIDCPPDLVGSAGDLCSTCRPLVKAEIRATLEAHRGGR